MTSPAGWYPDPQMTGTRRYWNGVTWTDHVAPAPDAPRQSDAALVAGWLCAVLVPPVGMGLALSLPRRHQGHRAWMLTVSAVLTFALPIFGFVVWANASA